MGHRKCVMGLGTGIRTAIESLVHYGAGSKTARDEDIQGSLLTAKVSGQFLWLALALCLAVTFPWQQNWPGISALAAAQQDSLLRWRAAQQSVDNRIVIIDIDEPSLTAMAPVVGRWPWPRSVHAELIQWLQQWQPEAIVFDVLMVEPDVYRPDDDTFFSEVLDGSRNVYLASAVRIGTRSSGGDSRLDSYPEQLGLHAAAGADPDWSMKILTPAIVQPQSWRTGAINSLVDRDGSVRRYPVRYQLGAGWSMPSLPAVVAADLGTPQPETRDIYLDWRSDSDNPYPRLSYAQLYGLASRGESLPADYHGKIFIVGSTVTGLHDIQVTPVSQAYPGVNILATALDNLLNQQQLQPVAFVWPWVGAVLALLLISVLLHRQKVLPVFFVVLLLSFLSWAASYMAINRGYLYSPLPMIFSLWAVFLVAVAVHYLHRYRQLRTTIHLFERFMDPQVVRELVRDGNEGDLLVTKSCQITVLFSDIRNFTHLSEERSAVEIVTLLDDYFSRQVEVIFRHKGTLDKFIGDAIMAFWGAPLSDEEQQRAAVSAALDMVEAMKQFRREYFHDQADSDEAFNIGVGIHTGPAVVGMVGSDRRFDYTAIGDTVNLASRIEGLTKDSSRILISESTRDGCRQDFDFEDFGEHRVKGRDKTVRVFSPRDLSG